MKNIILLLLLLVCFEAHAGNRRVRHLNPASAGATMAYDSRFLAGLANSDPVDTWASRRPATIDATSTSTARPLYQTGIVNGMPGLYFDGTDDSLTTGATFDATEATYMAVAVRETGATGNRCILGNRQSTRGRTWRTTATGLQASQIGGGAVTLTMTATSPFVSGFQASSAGNFFRSNVNGGAFSSTTYFYTSPTNNLMLGNQGVASEFLQGHIFTACIWPVVLTDALYRRFEQAFAFSFRIPQS